MIKVNSTEVISTLVFIGLDITIEKDGNEFDLELNVKYEDMPNFGNTEITWNVVDGDESILQDDMKDQLDDFIQEYVLENIGKF